jgi:RsiW-degrading membrane proteinase PrsW (M82 family)
VFIARGLTRRTARDGIVLGATVGLGFAALESSGYALNALVVVQNGHLVGLSLGDLVTTELLRGVLAPLGHGLWTGIVGGALFAATPHRGGLLSRELLSAYLLAALLHGLFDSMAGISTVISALSGLPPTVVGWGGLTLISLVGYFALHQLWRSAPPPRLAPAGLSGIG